MNMDLSEFLINSGIIIGGITVVKITLDAGSVIHSFYRENHPKKETGSIIIDLRSSSEKFMNNLGYKRILDTQNKMGNYPTFIEYCPWPNTNSDTIFGRFATKKRYYKETRSRARY